MALTVRIPVEDIATKILTYTKIELERSTAPDTGYSEVTELTLDADDVYYSYEDSSGTVTSWYRYRFSNAAQTVRSDYSNPFQLSIGTTRLLVRQRALEEYAAGMVLLSTTGGSSSTVLTADARFKSGFYPANRGKGSWIHPTSGSRTGETRQATATAPSTGTFTVDPVMSGALADLDQFEWHTLVHPYEWNLAINRGLNRYPYLDRVPIVGDAANERSLAFIPWLYSRRQVVGLWYYPNPTSSYLVEHEWGSGGRWWNIRDDAGGLVLVTAPALDTTETVYLEAWRTHAPLATDSSTLPGTANVDVVCALAYDEVLAALSKPRLGTTIQDRSIFIQQRQAHQRKLAALMGRYAPQPRAQSPQFSSPSYVPSNWKAR